VPGAGNSQAYNRYMYVFGNPLGRTDPSGHGACGGKSNDDFWQCRWFTAHGYTYFQGSGWSFKANAQFEDEGIARDVAREGGVTFKGTNGHEQSGVAPGVWSSDEIMASARAVFDLAYKIGGLGALAKLIGGRGATLYRHSGRFEWSGKEIAAMTEGWLPFGRLRVLHFYAGAFSAGEAFLRGTVVHELAHVIDYVTGTPSDDSLSRAFPRGSKISTYASEPSINQRLEYWAEGVTQCVYPDWKQTGGGFEALTVEQSDWILRVLSGRGFSK